MIECCKENIWRKKRRLNKGFIIFLVIILILSTLFLYYQFVVKKVIYSYSGEYLYSQSATSINLAVTNSLNGKLNYSDLVSVEKDVNGNIVLMNINSFKVNTISREIENLTFNTLSQKVKTGVKIPILAFIGLDFLSGYGKQIDFKVLSVSSVVCKFESEFTSVGINQTLHSIYITVQTNNTIFLPLQNKSNICKSKVLISETVLVGKVPDVYLNGKLFN